MQPPPRKVKESQQVKLIFSEQLSQLHHKRHQDTELLEEIRSFSKHRWLIEKEYAQALQRLAVQFQKRDWQRAHTELSSSGSVFGVWRSLVDATAQTAACRLGAAEKYRIMSGEASCGVRSAGDVRAKRGLEQLQLAQSEVVEALRELHRLKKNYHQLSHITNVAREKEADVRTRAEKNEHTGIFHFKTGLHKMAAKLGARLKQCDQTLTVARNDYLLTVASVNAHHHNYYTVELPHIMEQIDGSIYEDLKIYFCLLSETELDSCLSTHQNYSTIWDNLGKVTREKNIQLFLQNSPVFIQPTQIDFQRAPQDQVCSLQEVCVSESEGYLLKEAKKWAARAAKDHKTVIHGEKALQELVGRLKVLSGETGLRVEQKISEVHDSVRKAKVSRIQAEARLALLANSVTGIKQWTRRAITQAAEELDRERRLSEERRSAEDFSEAEFEETDLEEYYDDDVDDGVDVFTDPESAPGERVHPVACRVIYSYQACQMDELSITEGEDLQVVENGDMEDWLKVCNSCGQVGYVPEPYVQFLCLTEDDLVQLDTSCTSVSSMGSQERTGTAGVARALNSYQARSAEELSFQEGAIIKLMRCQHGVVNEGFWEGELDGHVGLFPSLVVELIHEDGLLAEEEKQDKEVQMPDVQTSPTLPPSSPALSISPSPGCSSKTQPPGVLKEDQLRTSPSCEGSDIRLKPCRPPPPPPTLTPPQPRVD